MDKDILKEALTEIFDERTVYDNQTHSDHHQFVGQLIEEAKRKRERRERLRQQVTGWGAITFLSGLGIGAYHLFVDFIKKVSH